MLLWRGLVARRRVWRVALVDGRASGIGVERRDASHLLATTATALLSTALVLSATAILRRIRVLIALVIVAATLAALIAWLLLVAASVVRALRRSLGIVILIAALVGAVVVALVARSLILWAARSTLLPVRIGGRVGSGRRVDRIRLTAALVIAPRLVGISSPLVGGALLPLAVLLLRVVRLPWLSLAFGAIAMLGATPTWGIGHRATTTGAPLGALRRIRRWRAGRLG